MVDLSCGLLRRRLWVLLALYPLLCFLGIRAVCGDVSFIFAMEKTVLPPWLLILVSVLISALVVSFVILLVLWLATLASLRRLLMLLIAALIVYVEDMLVWPSL